jgi:D-tyrosyl-tRNA(Tyr) deacylase
MRLKIISIGDTVEMIAVIQRVNHSYVNVEGALVARINKGILCLLGVQAGDEPRHAEKLIQKIIDLRIFTDADGKMNLSLQDVNGDLMLVSQFTLAGDCNKGRRPSFDIAEKPLRAKQIYEHAIEFAKKSGLKIDSGVFQADMKVGLENDGPVTFIIEIKD